MNRSITRLPTPRVDSAEVAPDHHRKAAKQALADAERNPVLSAEQSCAVAQVHALLAIEQRLGQLCGDMDEPTRYVTTNRP